MTNSFSADTTAIASQVNTNFTDVLTAINALDAGNLASGTVPLARISGLTVTQLAAATIVLESEGIGSNDNDTTWATCAAIIDYVAGKVGSANWTPTSYANEESVTYPNGLIEKNGFESASTSAAVSFDVAFPTALKTLQVTTVSSVFDFDNFQVDTGSYSKTGFTAHVQAITNLLGFFWTAKGY